MPELRRKFAIAGGWFMIGLQIVSYTIMHVFFFGVPHFTLTTLKGRSEIGYTLSCLLLMGFGAFFIYSGKSQRGK